MYKPIIGTLGYVLSPDRQRTLLVHRNARADDAHLGKWNGLGGKMNSNEDVAACLRRELNEEAGIEITEYSLRGTINWTGFGPNNEDWLGFIFLVTGFSGEPVQSCNEGDLAWVEVSRLSELPMWEGDRHFIPLVFDDDPRQFHGFMPYAGDRPLSWNYVRI